MKKKTRPGSSNKYSHLSRIRFFPSLAQYPPERGFLTGFVLAVVIRTPPAINFVPSLLPEAWIRTWIRFAEQQRRDACCSKSGLPGNTLHFIPNNVFFTFCFSVKRNKT